MKNEHLTEKEIKELGDKYKDLLKELSYQLMQTVQVLKIANSMPEEEKKHIQELSECATNMLFTASLRDLSDLIDIYHILDTGFVVSEHMHEIRSIALKYVPETLHKVKPLKCTHTLSGKRNEFNEIQKSLARLTPMIEELKQYEIKDKFHTFKKYYDKKRSM